MSWEDVEMITKRFLGTICAAFIMSACGPVPLLPVTYDDEILAQSDLAAFVELNTGRVTGHSASSMIYAGGIFVPVSTGPVPELQFDASDQAIFVDSLKTEMQRHGIVGSISDAAENDTLDITINFVQTEHFPSYQEYKLTVSMLTQYGDLEVANRYEVLSSEGDSGWTKWNTNASTGKKKAAAKLMDLVLTDLQDFVLQIQDVQAHAPSET